MKKPNTKTNFSSRIGFVLTAVLIGYAVRPETVIEEAEQNGVFRSKKLYTFMIRFVVPLCMVIILISSIFGIV